MLLMREAAANSVGLPLSVQVIGLPFRDEDCLRLMRIIERLWKKKEEGNSQMTIASKEVEDPGAKSCAVV
jgi:hypothetical protein